MEVYDLIPNWPFSIHALTNYGIYIFTFSHKNQSDARIFTDYFDVKLIRLHTNFKGKMKYSYDYAANDWGYAFLMAI
jgi:hypothetical protein